MHAIRSRNVVTPKGVLPATIVVDGALIKAIEPHNIVVDNCVDYGDWAILPGVVDTHVHMNDPGRTEWEDFDCATSAAAAGGITTLVDMPLNCIPVTTDVAALRQKISAASGRIAVDCGFWGGVVPGNLDEIEPMLAAGALGFKSFLCDSGIPEFAPVGAGDLGAAMRILAAARAPYLIHAELEQTLSLAPNNGEGSFADPRSYRAYLDSRPKSWENSAVELLARLSGEFGARTHVVHLSSAQALPFIASARERGVALSAETCHHYLNFAAEDIPDGATEYKCAPPIREMANNAELWEALESDLIDFAVSDHSPCAPALKLKASGDFDKAWGGIAGLQFGLSIFHTAAVRRGWDLERIARTLSQRPAVFAGLGHMKGSIEPGKHADFAVLNTKEKFIVTADLVRHKHDVTPYIGRELIGAVRATYLRGSLIYDGKNVFKGNGRTILR